MKKQHHIKLDRRSRLRRVDKSLAVYGLALGAAVAATGRAEATPIYFDAPDVTLRNGQGDINLNLSNLINPNPGNPPDAVINYSRDVSQNTLNLQFNSLNNGAGALSNPLSFNDEIGCAICNSDFLGSFNLATLNPSGGNWIPVGPPIRNFLGIRVDIPGGSPHFGWVGLIVDSNLDVTMYDFAIESDPNTPIAAGATAAVPEPGTLTLLALGASGLAAWRKRRASR